MRCLSARKSKKGVIDKESFDILSTFVLLCRPQDPEFSSPAASLSSGASVGAIFIIRWESAREKERPIYFHFGKRMRGRKGRKEQECSEGVASQVGVVSSAEQAHDALWYRISYIL